MSPPTEQQRRAIEATGAVLLAAGAGTGKTATLVSRCVRLVTEMDVEIDRLLVITFTNAAAAELKQRLREALRERLADQPDDAGLQRQILLLEGAHISTIHAFCLELIRAHFAELDLDPGVTVLDESVAVPLARKIVKQVAAAAFAAGGQALVLAEKYCGSSADRLGELILRTHRFFVTQPQADQRLLHELKFFESGSANGWRSRRDAIMAAWFMEVAPLVRAQIPCTLEALRAVKGYGGKGSTAEGIRRIESGLQILQARLAALSHETVETELSGLLEQAVGMGEDGLWVHGTKKCRRYLERFLEEADLLKTWRAGVDTDPLDWEWAEARGPMHGLLELTRDFASAFTNAKRSLGGVDFADLEQLALRLLLDEAGEPTSVATAWRARIEHVFVDECQDVNAAQDALIRAIAREGESANLFMVGDVKQSIYRFRMAAPELFRRHAKDWRTRKHHQVLPLTENFRSRAGIIAFANDLFGCLLAPGLGPVAYGPDERLAFALPGLRSALSLAPGGQGPKGAGSEPDCRVELHLVYGRPRADGGEVSSTESDWGDLLDIERQARIAAVRLRDLFNGGHEVWDKGHSCFRRLQWSDVGLLMRSVRGRTGPFLREFRRFGIPLSVEQGDFLETLEASDLTCLLRVLDNPRQDIPLFAVLRSPLVGWTLEELVLLRASGKSSGTWERLEEIARLDGVHSQRAKGFLNDLARWRRLALMTSVTCVLETVLTETRYEAFLFTLPDGPERVANVRRFLDLAHRYDPLQRQGLFRFLRFLDEQKEGGREFEPLPPRQVDAVQLMSIHKSKGLEFPVVLLAGIGAPIQTPEVRDGILFSRRWGLSPQVVDLKAQRRHDSLVLWRAKREERLASIAEEIRLLYVAVTRARDTLLLVGSFNPEGEKWNERFSTPPAIGIAQSRSYADWIGLWIGPGVDWSAGSGEIELKSEEGPARIRWWTYSEASFLAKPCTDNESGEAQAPGASLAPVALRWQDLNWRYKHIAATQTPAKTSASALRRFGERLDEDGSVPWPPRRAFAMDNSHRPEGLSSKESGTIHHVFLQHLNLAQTGSKAELIAEAERLRVQGLLTDIEVQSLDLDSVLEFWNSSFGREIQEQRAHVRREVPFTAAFTPAELPFDSLRVVPPEDFVVVQGAIDLAVILPEEIWLVDFKTDRVTEAESSSRAAEHEAQLRLYARALHRIYQRLVSRCLLYFLVPRRLVVVSSR